MPTNERGHPLFVFSYYILNNGAIPVSNNDAIIAINMIINNTLRNFLSCTLKCLQLYLLEFLMIKSNYNINKI